MFQWLMFVVVMFLVMYKFFGHIHLVILNRSNVYSSKIWIQWFSFDVTTSSLFKPLPTPAMFFIALFLPFDFHPLVYPVSFCLNQQLGTAHLVCWLRYAFSQFFYFFIVWKKVICLLSTIFDFVVFIVQIIHSILDQFISIHFPLLFLLCTLELP